MHLFCQTVEENRFLLAGVYCNYFFDLLAAIAVTVVAARASSYVLTINFPLFSNSSAFQIGRSLPSCGKGSLHRSPRAVVTYGVSQFSQAWERGVMNSFTWDAEETMEKEIWLLCKIEMKTILERTF